jgi:hypothetical protein
MRPTARPNPAVVAVCCVVLSLVALAAASLVAMPVAADQTAASTTLSIHMSDRDGGPAARTFVSTTNRLFAVVTYADAANESYAVRLRDMVGIEVFNAAVRLSGTGKVSKPISVADFVAAYRGRVGTETDALDEGMGALANLCKNPPGSPQPTSTPAGPTPGAPTPTPDSFARWRGLMLDAVVSSKSTGAEFDRTLTALGAMPDVQANVLLKGDLGAGRTALAAMLAALDRAESALSPSAPRPGTPEPSPPVMPDPAAACAAVGEAALQRSAAATRTDAVMGAMPTDLSAWRIAPATALYSGTEFVRCQPYIIELVAPGSGGGEGTAAASSPWTIGQPGQPALMFPGPDQTDRSEVQQLGIHMPEGADSIYASTVTVPGVNHMATVSAFVTDAQCIPVDGVTITFGIDPSKKDVDPATEGSLSPREAVIRAGVVTTTLTAGITASLGSEVTSVVCVGTCLRPEPGKPRTQPTTGTRPFSVIGPVKTMVLMVPKKVVNRLLHERAEMSVRALDAFGRNVADGTEINLRIEPGSPGVLARDVRAAGSPTSQVDALGKSARLLTRSGFSYVPPGNDPGLTYSTQIFLMPSTDGDGEVELTATSDGITEHKLVTIVSKWPIYLPLTLGDSPINPRRPTAVPAITPRY